MEINNKTFAQAFAKRGDSAQVNKYTELALNLFQQVRRDTTASDQEHARALHGTGNIEYIRFQYHAAIDDYKLATEADPDTPYAWYDAFLAYAGAMQETG